MTLNKRTRENSITRKRAQEFQAWLSSVGWESGYFKHRPKSILTNQRSSSRNIVETAKGTLPGTTLPIDLMVIAEIPLLWSWRETRVMRIITNRTFSRLVINRYSNDTIIADTTDNLVPVEKSLMLEGDFYKYFNVLCEKDKEQEALTILSPDVMQILTELPPRIDIEFSGNSVFIYFRSSTSRLEFKYSIEAIFVAASLIVGKVLHIADLPRSGSLELFERIKTTYTLSQKQKAWQITYMLFEMTCLFGLTVVFVLLGILKIRSSFDITKAIPLIAICYAVFITVLVRRLQKQYISK